MTRSEALSLLALYAPALRPGRSPAQTLLAEIGRRGHQLGVDTVSGAWVILNASAVVVTLP